MKVTNFMRTLFTLLLTASTSSALHCSVCPDEAESACSYVEKTSVKAFPSSQLTFETWLWIGQGGYSAGLIEYRALNSLGQASRMFAVAVTSTAAHITIHDQEAVVPLPSGLAKRLAIKSWSHFAVTWQATTATLQVFVNGQPSSDESQQLSSTKNIFMQSGGSLRLGRYNNTLAVAPVEYYGDNDQNLMQEVRVWTTALKERYISQTLRVTSMPSYTGIFGHWRLWGNSSSDLYDLAQAATGNDRSLTLVGKCHSDLSITVASDAGTTGAMPGSYELMEYSSVPLLGLGMASGKQYALDVGNEIQISSFGDGNVVECTNGQTITLQNQGIGTMGAIRDGDAIQGIMGVQAVGTRQPPQMPLVPRSFQGKVFALPNIRGNTLYLTVKSLADDLSEAEADDAASALSSETVTISSRGMTSVATMTVSEKCQATTPIDISGTDTAAGAYRLTKVMDNDPDSWWRMNSQSCKNDLVGDESNKCGSYNWYAQTEYASPVVIDRYSFSVSTTGKSKNEYPKKWYLQASADGTSWNTITTKTDVVDWAYEETRQFWGTTKASRATAYKFWRVHFTEVQNNGRRIYLGEIQFQTCGGGVPWSINTAAAGAAGNMDDNSPTSLTLNKEDVLSFTTISSSVDTSEGTPNVVLTVASGSDSWAFTQEWKCTSIEPAWHWILPNFDDADDADNLIWTTPTITPDEVAKTLTLTFEGASTSAHHWCRSALANQPDLLILWDSRFGTKQTRRLSKGGVTQFQITDYSGQYYHVLKSETLVVVSSRTEDYDARPVPAAGKRIVGFRSANMYVAPAYKDTRMDIYYFQDALEKNYQFAGNPGMDKVDPDNFIPGKRYHRSSSSQMQCRSAMFMEGDDVLGAAQYADYDGLEATPFVPMEMLSTEWVLPMEAEYVAFLAVRPDSPNKDGYVDLKVYSPNGLLKEEITEFKRFSGTTGNDNGLDPLLRPSCYNYYPVSGIPPGTRFVTDYPAYMAWEIKASDDETVGSGRGAWVWAQVDRTTLRVTEKGDTTGANGLNSVDGKYRVRFSTHDATGKLGNLGQPTKPVVVSMTSDAQVSITPTTLTFNKDNWLDWQTVTVTANTDYVVENLVVTSTIRHTITSTDVQYANGRVNVPDVKVDVINTDYKNVPENVRVTDYTGGLVAVAWDAPKAAEQEDSGQYNYAVEMTARELVQPTLITTSVTCDTPGCVATKSIEFVLDRELRAASLTVKVRQTDFDDDAELVEYIAVNGKTIRTNCNPGGPPIGGGLCSDEVQDQMPSCVSGYQLNTTLVKASIIDEIAFDEEGKEKIIQKASVTIQLKASKEVDKSTCLSANVTLLHADVYLTLMYKSADEIYYGPHLAYEKADLTHSTNYKIRVTSSSPQGIFSSYSDVISARTKKPTAPTAPRDTEMLTSTGGAVHAQWVRPLDTGGAALVNYFVQATQLNGGLDNILPYNHQIDAISQHNSLSSLAQNTFIYGLRPFSTYNVSLYATNEVEFCEGPGPSCKNATMETIRPTLPGAPHSIKVTETTGGAIAVEVSPPLDRGGHPRLVYDVAYRKVTIPFDANSEWTYDHGREGSVLDSDTYITTIVNLLPNTQYEIKARAVVPSDGNAGFTETRATCSDPDAGTTCNAHNVDSPTCINKARTDASGATCVFAAATAATCTDPDAGTTCNAHNADSATCIAQQDANSDTCIFAAAAAATCTDPDAGTTCNTHNADSSTCITKPRQDAAGATCVFAPITTMPTGCTCSFDISRTDCACCVDANAVHCGSTSRMMCVHKDEIDLAIACNGDTMRKGRSFVMNNGNNLLYSTLEVDTASFDYSEFTWEGWVSVPSGSTTVDFVLWQIRSQEGEGEESITIGYKNQKFYVADESDADKVEESITRAFGTAAKDEKWVHVAVSRDKSDNTIILMINGFVVATGTLEDMSSKTVGTATETKGYVTTVGVAVHVDNVRVFTELRSLDTIRHQMSIALPPDSIKTDTILSTFNTQMYSVQIMESDRLVGPWLTASVRQHTLGPSEAYILTAPVVTKETGGAGRISWENRDDHGGQSVVGYSIYVSEAGAAICTKRATLEEWTGTGREYALVELTSIDVPAEVRSVRVVHLSPSSTYKVCVGALNGFQPKSFSPVGTLTTSAATAPGTPPAPTVDVTKTTEWDELAIKWEEPADIGGSPVTGFKLRRKQQGEQNWETPAGWNDGDKILSFIDGKEENKGLAPAKVFEYRIMAVNNEGTSVGGPSLTLMSKAKCPYNFYPDGVCSSFA